MGIINKNAHKKALQSRKTLQGAYYGFMALDRKAQNRIQAKLNQVMPEGSRFLNLNQ